MKLLCLTKYTRQGPSSRYRVYQFVPYLEQAGIEVDIQTLHGDGYLERMFAGERPSPVYLVRRWLKRMSVLLGAGRYDLVFIQKELFPRLPDIFEAILRRRGVDFVLDFDDAIFVLYEELKSPLAKAVLQNKLPRVIGKSRLVLAGNEFLAEYARRYSRRVVRFPTVVDTERFKPAASGAAGGVASGAAGESAGGVAGRGLDSGHPPAADVANGQERSGHDSQASGLPVVGWMGSPETVGFIEEIRPALESLARKTPFELRLIGAEPVPIEGVAVTSRPWSEASEVDELRRFDIGIMPLSDSRWAQGKCSLKLLQYMGVGVAAVSSPVGSARDVIHDGVNGFLAATTREWVEKLDRLLGDPGLRAGIGMRGRETVVAAYSLQVLGPRLAELLLEASSHPV